MDHSDINALLGMSESELYEYLKEVLQDEASEAAAESGKSIEEELDSPGFASAAAASTYAIRMIMANNAFITRQLIDRGVLPTVDEGE